MKKLIVLAGILAVMALALCVSACDASPPIKASVTTKAVKAVAVTTMPQKTVIGVEVAIAAAVPKRTSSTAKETIMREQTLSADTSAVYQERRRPPDLREAQTAFPGHANNRAREKV